jgi:membrane-bound serine protease (ClpP class)
MRRSEPDPRRSAAAGWFPAEPARSRHLGTLALPGGLTSHLARLLLALLAAATALVSLAAPASAVTSTSGSEEDDLAPADPAPAGTAEGFVSVIEVDGLVDRVLADFIEDQIDRAAADGAIALVLQLNSTGAVIADTRLVEVADAVAASSVPVHVWIGPSGSQALGGATALVGAAARRCDADPAAIPCTGIAPRESRVEVTRDLLGDAPVPEGVALGDRVTTARAVELGLVDVAAPSIGDLVVDIPGVQTRVVERGEVRQREPITPVRFAQLPLQAQLMHTVASPPVAYLLFVIGLALVIFELFTAGVGIAGVVGAVSIVLGSYGLAELPTRPLGVALLLVAAFGYAVDVQTGVPRLWTGIATVAFVAGSVVLYDGVSLSWLTLAVGIVGMTLAMVAGMPAMVRTRFSTPTIGREWMVGDLGTAAGPVAPDGIVTVRGAPWRARTNRATPVQAGEQVRVVAIDGLVLEVEPLEGAARDHRERQGSDRS